MINIILGFPFNLLPGIILTSLFFRINSISVTALLSIGMLYAGYYLPTNIAIIFWSPGGMATIISSSFAIFALYYISPRFITSNLPELPNRNLLRAKLSSVTSLEERKILYINFVQSLSQAAGSVNRLVTSLNTWFLLLILIASFIVNYSVFYLGFIKNGLFKEIFSEIYSQIMVEPTTSLKETENDLYQLVIQYSAFFTFLQISAVFFIISFFYNKIAVIKNQKRTILGHLGFFRISDYFILLFIVFALGLAYIYFKKIDLFWVPIYENIFFILCTLYIYQALSTLWLYFYVRMLPFGQIAFVTIILGTIFPFITGALLLSLLIIGLLEFRFEFRKKALQPDLTIKDTDN